MDFTGLLVAWIWGCGIIAVLSAPFRKRTSDANIAPALVMGAAAVASAAINWLKSRGTNNAEKEARELYNAYLTGRTDVANKIIEGAKAQGFDPYGPQVTTQSGGGTSESFTRGTQDSTTSSRPEITAEYQPLEEQLRSLIEGRLGKGQFSNEELVSRTLANRVRAINRGSAGATQNVLNLAGRRGLSAQQIIGAGSPIAAQRTGQIADVVGNVPMEARELENQDLNFAKGAISAFGRGDTSRTKGITTSSTTGSNQGYNTTTAPPNLSALFSMLAPTAPQAGANTGFSPGLQAGGDLVSALAKLYASRGGSGYSGYNYGAGSGGNVIYSPSSYEPGK